jgi:adenine C2-methylase RlmN of 23S rRNA A2503 and tRNA A37
MNKALGLYDDIYGQWRTYFELWRFSFHDDKINDSQRYAKKLFKLKPEYPQSYIAYLASHDPKDSSSKSKKIKLYNLVKNFSPSMVKNFHSWIRSDQAEKIIAALKIHLN